VGLNPKFLSEIYEPNGLLIQVHTPVVLELVKRFVYLFIHHHHVHEGLGVLFIYLFIYLFIHSFMSRLS